MYIIRALWFSGCAEDKAQWREIIASVMLTRSGEDDNETSCSIQDVYIYIYTGLFISPSGISELDCATTKTHTAERSISIGTESLKVFFCTRGLGVLVGSTARG